MATDNRHRVRELVSETYPTSGPLVWQDADPADVGAFLGELALLLAKSNITTAEAMQVLSRPVQFLSTHE